jgi:transposase
MIERGPVWIGHKHRGEAAVRYFAGLDVSLEETAICIIDETGSIVREARVVSEPDALVSFFDALGMTLERVGLEACSLTAWLHQGLSRSGDPGRLHRGSPSESRDGCDAEQD